MELCSLPLELWQVILAYLPLPDLGRSSLVCQAWRDLILSLDKTRWRQLCLGCPECRHPNWPNCPQREPPSWRDALRQHTLASRIWAQNGSDLDSFSCLYLFRRRKDQRVWHVGTGCEHKTLREALATAGAYDRVFLHSGVYEEQAEVALRVPVEIVGKGKLGEVTLLVSIVQQCSTARLCNLVIMPPWFSPVVYKTSSGHVQLDNCNLEVGQLQVRGPGTCHVRFCSFGRSSGVHFQGVAFSLLDSCDFSGSDAASVTVEGSPVSDHNWACKHLAALAKSTNMELTTATAVHKERVERSLSFQPPAVVVAPEGLCRKEEDVGRYWAKEDKGFEGRTAIRDSCSKSEPSMEEEMSDSEDILLSAGYILSHHHHGLSHLLDASSGSFFGTPAATPELRSLQRELQQDKEAQALVRSVRGCLLRRCLFRDGKGGVLVFDHGWARLEGNVFRGLTYAVRCIQHAKIVMLRNEVCWCRASGVFLRLSANGLIAENEIHSNNEAGLDIRKGANPIILCNRIHSGMRSGIVVLGNGKGSIRSNQIYGNREAGIYILYNGNPVVSGNHIFQGRAAGIAVNENGRGLIDGNVIWENQWGGADIRRGGDPILRNNFICHGYSDGVVVGERGRGLIEGNHIYCNKGCGVWVMSSSLPHVSGNRITHNGIYGVAVFCQKDSEAGGDGGGGGRGRRIDSYHDEGELMAWESDLESEDKRFPPGRPTSVALVEGNCVSHHRAEGVYVNSNEPLNVVGNAIHSNRGAGVSVLQSGPLTWLVNNWVCHNSHTGVTIETGCSAELRGNGVYDNGSHGVSFRGVGQILENDVVGNCGCGIRVMESAEVKVLRNRIQPLGSCGISVLGQAKGLVLENMLFQGRPSHTKPLIYRDPANQTCLLLNNTLLACSTSVGQADPTWALENPPPRPQLEIQSITAPSGLSAHRTITRRGRITTSGCHSNSSIFCAIL